jgi:hypothetical protein
VADPRPERGAPAHRADGSASVRLRGVRPPRPANDNAFPWLRQVSRLLPLLAAAALLAWALVHAFGGP